MEDPVTVGRLVAAGHKRVEEFSWQKAAMETWKVYQLLLAG